jgi:hypothetical protein
LQNILQTSNNSQLANEQSSKNDELKTEGSDDNSNSIPEPFEHDNHNQPLEQQHVYPNYSTNKYFEKFNVGATWDVLLQSQFLTKLNKIAMENLTTTNEDIMKDASNQRLEIPSADSDDRHLKTSNFLKSSNFSIENLIKK